MADFDTLHEEFRLLAEAVWDEVQSMCGKVGCSAYIASTYRSPEKQLELYSRGRKKVGHKWIRTGGKIVTRALPYQTPHCKTLEDGTPASCAIDIALVENGMWLRDWDERWSIIPTAVAMVNREKLKSGAFFRSIRDYPHVELRNWKEVK